MNVHDYDEGFKTGYRKGLRLQHRYAWDKLFLVVFAASFLAFAALWALVTFV